MKVKTFALLAAIPLVAVLAAVAVPLAPSQRAGAPAESDAARLHALAKSSKQSGDFARALEALERAAALFPADPAGHHLVAVHYLEKSKEPSVGSVEQRIYAGKGLDAANRALAADPEYGEALIYKSLLLRELAGAEENPESQRALIREADTLRRQVGAVERGRAAAGGPGAWFNLSSAPEPPPPPPVPGAGEIQWVYGETSYTMSGQARHVQRLTEVRPIYPPMAIELGVSGTVVLEAVVDRRGRISEARILESVPLLNQSTIHAVRRWQFDPEAAAAAGRPVISVTATFTPPR